MSQKVLLLDTMSGYSDRILKELDRIETVCVSSVEQLREAVNMNDADLLLLSIEEQNAESLFDLCRWIRKESHNPSFPIVIMARDEKDEKLAQKSFESGANDFIRSSFSDREGGARVLVHLNLYRMLVRNERLVEEISASDVELMVIRKKLESLSRLKDDFIHFTSHDLRSYLSTVTSLAKGLSDGLFGDLDEEQDDVLKRIVRQCDSAMEFTAQMLDLGKFEGEGVELAKEKVVISKLIQDVMDQLSQSASDRKVTFSFQDNSGGIALRVDTNLLSRVFFNFCENAVKYSKPPCEVRIDSCVEDKEFVFSVTDCSDPIKTDDPDAIFNKFSRLSKAKGYAGWGLGLALCRRIVEMHGGKIGFEPLQNSGNRFYFLIPLE